MEKILLSQNQFTIVDDEDFDFLNQWKWFATWNECTKSFYAGRNIRKEEKKTTIQMSRVLMGNPKELFVDHKNHDTLDNRRENLRIVTKAQNNTNRRRRSYGKAKMKGVSDLTGGAYKSKPFLAQIQVNKKRIFLGYYPTAEIAG